MAALAIPLIGKILATIPLWAFAGALAGAGVGTVHTIHKHVKANATPKELGFDDIADCRWVMRDPLALDLIRSAKGHLFPDWVETSKKGRDVVGSILKAYTASQKPQHGSGTMTDALAAQQDQQQQKNGMPSAARLAPFQELVRGVNDLLELWHVIANRDALRANAPDIDAIPWRLRALACQRRIENCIFALSPLTSLDDVPRAEHEHYISMQPLRPNYVLADLVQLRSHMTDYVWNIDVEAGAALPPSEPPL
jgi:hypothetical protein